MGAVLAMSKQSPIPVAARWAAVVLTILAGCSSEPTGTTPDQLLGDIARDIGPRSAGEAGNVRDISELNRAAIAGVSQPLALLTIPDVEVATTVTVGARKGNVVTWRSADGGAVLLDGPVLFATRGVGFDLLSAETQELRVLLNAGRGGTVTRRYRHLDGLDQIQITDFTCQLTRRGQERIVILERSHLVTRFDERCQAESVSIENTYWLDAGGFPWKSRQWLGPVPGYLTFERLVR